MANEAPGTDQDTSNSPRGCLPIVGIGASAGGIRALQTFFADLPCGLGAAFVVIVHLDPNTRSELASILAAHTKFSVEQVTSVSALKPDHVYVIAPDRQLSLSDHEIAAVPFDEPRGRRAPIDLFFRSLAEKGGGFAVILTGAGSDGAVGVKAVKEAGGIVLVQDPEEAEYPSMPHAAIATEVADFVLPIKELTARLVELVKDKPDIPLLKAGDDYEKYLPRVLAYLQARTGHDFSHYKETTVHRRLQRRMQVTRTGSLERYHAYMRENAGEAQALLADLLISVTTFFRNPEAFEALERSVIPRIFEEPRSGAVRAWVAGCATGEEAYSIAILLLEEAARHDVRPEVRVFASDLDSGALAIAREGRYLAAIQADLSEERLRRFFNEDGEYYRVKRELRDSILFANHSLLKDPPFTRLDLISCRNLLIYLDRDTQQEVLSTLHYGLNPNGYLFLGSSESADHPEGYFRAVNRENRIFESTGRTRHQLPALPQRIFPASVSEHLRTGREQRNVSAIEAHKSHREALESGAPPSVLVDKSNRVVHLSETAGRYLQPQGGQLTADITDLVREELRPELRAALHRAFERGEDTLSAALFVRFNGTPQRVYVQVKPLVVQRGKEEQAERALVLFIEGGREEPLALRGDDGSGEQPANESIRRLQQELELMQARLRSTREDSEAANDELRAANEELQSINEEYRSTAEELETSKEELQAINEELQTVNNELKLKLDAVSRAHNDLLNLMAATDVGTLFLDPELRIKRFTPRITDLFNITTGDIGRPITHFTHPLDYEGLVADAIHVIRDLDPLEREISSRSGAWYLVRLRPYRTADNKIDGVVATFVDVTERRRTEDALRQSEQKLKREMQLVELSRAPIIVWDYDDGVVQWNRGSEELYGYTREEAIGQATDRLLKTGVPISSFDALRKELLEKGSWSGELRQVAKNGRSLIVETQIELLEVDSHRFVLESTRDITQRKALETRQQLLVTELTHRVKNLLAVVQGMVHQTSQGSASAQDIVKKLDGRISALARSQKILIDSAWEGADLRKLIENQLAPYIGDDRSRLHLSGEDVSLPADIAIPMGLVVHELATNALKYGALSEAKGHVELSWNLNSGNNTRVLKVLWRERDGPRVTTSSSAGFGSRLITKGLPGAKVEHELLVDGVACSIELPLRTEA